MIGERSVFRIAWDLLIVLLIIASCAVIPVQLVFSDPPRGLTPAIYWLDMVFFIDIGLNFLTSFRRAGIEVTEVRATSRHYSRTMLGIDLLANLPFDRIVLFLFGTAAAGAAPLLALLRLLRLVRLFIIFARWELIKQVNPGVLRLVKYIAVIALATSALACVWLAIGRDEAISDEGWIHRSEIVDASDQEQYVRALYWTVTTMTTVGYGDITPEGNREYLFAILVMFAGASLYAFIIGSVASLLSSLNAARSVYRDHVQSLSGYLHQRSVDPELHDRAIDYMDYMWARRHSVGDESLLATLPKPLQIEIKADLAQEILERVPLFEHSSQLLRDVLLDATTIETHEPASRVCREGDTGDAIYFVIDGELSVIRDGSIVATLTSGDYFGHLSILLGERRTAAVRAESFCNLMRLDRLAFESIRETYPEIRETFKRAAGERDGVEDEKMADLLLSGVVL